MRSQRRNERQVRTMSGGNLRLETLLLVATLLIAAEVGANWFLLQELRSGFRNGVFHVPSRIQSKTRADRNQQPLKFWALVTYWVGAVAFLDTLFVAIFMVTLRTM